MTATDLLILSTCIGAATVGGVFFAFSSFVMKALAQLRRESRPRQPPERQHLCLWFPLCPLPCFRPPPAAIRPE